MSRPTAKIVQPERFSILSSMGLRPAKAHEIGAEFWQHGAFGTVKYERLVTLKNRYDPDNLFRLNQNIKPTRGAGQAALA